MPECSDFAGQLRFLIGGEFPKELRRRIHVGLRHVERGSGNRQTEDQGIGFLFLEGSSHPSGRLYTVPVPSRVSRPGGCIPARLEFGESCGTADAVEVSKVPFPNGRISRQRSKVLHQRASGDAGSPRAGRRPALDRPICR